MTCDRGGAYLGGFYSRTLKRMLKIGKNAPALTVRQRFRESWDGWEVIVRMANSDTIQMTRA